MSKRRLELDAALADRKPLLLVWKGEEYNLPGAIPAKAVLDYLPVIAEKGGVPQEQIGQFFCDIIGEENYRALLDKGLSWPDLQTVVEWAVKEYGLVPAGDEEEEEALTPPGRPT